MGTGSAVAIVLLAILADAGDDRRIVTIESSSGSCHVSIDGQHFNATENRSALDAYLAKLSDKRRPITLNGPDDVPYRCIADFADLLKKHEIGAIGFVSEPPRP